jgi:hypothetical protein
MLVCVDWREKELVQAVRRLAASPDEQVAHVRRLGSYPSLDELALEFDDVFGPPGTTPPAGGWGDALRRLDATLSAMSGPENAHLWEPDALHGPEWAKVRARAREALARRPR